MDRGGGGRRELHIADYVSLWRSQGTVSCVSFVYKQLRTPPSGFRDYYAHGRVNLLSLHYSKITQSRMDGCHHHMKGSVYHKGCESGMCKYVRSFGRHAKAL